MNRPALSIVSTLYKSAPYVAEFCARAAKAALAIAGEDYEIVLVNDGSPDNSLDLAVAAAHADPRVRVVDLSRNFGHHKAMMTGLMHARGERIFLVDSDLEEEPEWLVTFDARLREVGGDVVYGVQTKRKGSGFERLTGRWFYRLFNVLTGMRLPPDIVVARLMTRRYVEALVSHEERELFMAGLWHVTGFAQTPVMVDKHDTSPTTYTIRHKLSMLVNSVTSFSNKPLYLIFYVGLAISIFASVWTLYLVLSRLFTPELSEGWTSVMASVWLIGGLIISFLGVIGIYLAKIFAETKRRPYTIVRDVHHFPDGPPSGNQRKTEST